MKKTSFILSLIMIICSLDTPFLTFAEETAVEEETVEGQQIALPDLGIEINEVSAETAEKIDDILSEMDEIAAETNELLADTDAVSVVSEELANLNEEYEMLESEAENLGCVFLTDEQAIRYVYGDASEEASTNASISYPSISGIKFAITYYTYDGTKMAKCVATQASGTTSKLVKNYDTVEMYGETKISTLVGKGIKMTATRLSSYLLGSLSGGVVNYTVDTLSNLSGMVFPSSSSSSKAKLSLAVSTNSTVVHIWKYVNDNYYLRTSTVKAKITETWVLRDTNGDHTTATHSYTSYSSYYNSNAHAVSLSTNQSYGINQTYKVQNALGLYVQKQSVTPYTAALPASFST